MVRFLAGATAGLVLVLGVVAIVGPPASAEQPAPIAVTQAAPPEVTPEDLRALIYADDRSAVADVFTALPVDTKAAQDRQRQLFGVFSEVHPKMIAFAKAWAEDEPKNPAALAARGWSLHSQGWNFRGKGYAHQVYPQAMEAFQAAHAEGLRLMQEAVVLEPSLLAASDGILKMSYTIGRNDLIAPEVARIMDIAPNRFTMTLSGSANAPNWGGSVDAIRLLCKAHAAKVTDRPGYDADVCLFDGVMQSGAMSFQDARQLSPAIARSDNPMILEWQDRDADIQGETAVEKLAHLDKLKAERPLTYLEANIYDQMSGMVATMTGEQRPLEFPLAVARKAEDALHYADRNPGDWGGAERLLYARMEDRDVNGTKFDYDEFNRRAQASLEINPFNAGAWGHLGTSKLMSGGEEEEGIFASEPYFINATAYSNHASEHLKMLGGTKLSLLFRNMANGVKPDDPKQWQEGVLCPMVRQLRLLEAVCAAERRSFSECANLPWEPDAIQGQIKEFTSAGTCQTEAEAPLEELVYSPVAVDLVAQ